MKIKRIVCILTILCMLCVQTAFAYEVNLKNFIVQPDLALETFENGNISSDFLTLSTSAVTSRIETEDDNSYLVFEDGEDDESSALLTISPPGNCSWERFVFTYDIYMPDIYPGAVNPQSGKSVNSITLNFNAIDDELASSARPVYYTFSRNANNKWIYYIVDAGQDWLGGEIELMKWYTVRYEVNMRTHRYNMYLIERDNGNIKGSMLNRKFRDKSTNGASFPIDDYYISSVTLTVDAKNNGGPINVMLDNIAFAKEKFYIPSQPLIEIDEAGNVVANATIYNETYSDGQSPMLVLGIYDANNKLVSVSYNALPVAAMNTGASPVKAELKCSLTKPMLNNNYEARAFLITSLYSGKLLSSLQSMMLE